MGWGGVDDLGVGGGGVRVQCSVLWGGGLAMLEGIIGRARA